MGRIHAAVAAFTLVVLAGCTTTAVTAGGDAPATGVVEVRCLDGSTELTVSHALVRSDGVELRVLGTGPLRFYVYGEDGHPIVNTETDDLPGTQSSDTSILPLVPGKVLIECDGKAVASDRARPLVIEDPEGIWHDDTLACEDFGRWSSAIGVSFPTAEDPAIAEALATALPSVEPTDVIDHASYPDRYGTPYRYYRVTRDGVTKAVLEVGERENDRTEVTWSYACRDWIAAADAEGSA